MIAYLDVNCLIYFVEKNPLWWPRIVARIATLRAVGGTLAVSDLSRAECLVGPYKSGNAAVLASYHAVFSDPEIQILPITPAACDRSARMRAATGLKLPDALHLAIAIEFGCGLFLTNDLKLARCQDIPVEILK